MKSVRNSVFETNSSSTHSLTLFPRHTKNSYNLSESGYLEAGFGSYCSESSYEVYTTVEEKLRFLLTLLASFYYNKKRKIAREKTGKWTYPEFTTQRELKATEEFKEIQSIIKRRIKNCKGLRFRKGSFLENGEVYGCIDAHHQQNCNTLKEYLEKNNVTLEQFLFDPNLIIQMNR